ncbi:MAG: lysylphosphatidylglycerol synthase domain-containing protein [Nitrospirales bacterium]|nr:lysylphosphatidylglycerol synthase domain-containing protein [Nitrospirales bacterium]
MPHSRLTTVVFLLGLILFAILMWQTGIHDIGKLVWDIGWAIPLIWLPFVFVVLGNSCGWWAAFQGPVQPLMFLKLIRISIAAQAIQLITPSIAQAGELLKIHLLRSAGVPLDVGIASVVGAKTTIILTELLFIGFGLFILPKFLAIDASLLTSLTIGLVAISLLFMGLIIWQRMGLFRPMIWLGRRLDGLTVLIDRHEGVLTSTDEILKSFLGRHKRFSLSCLGHLLGWAAGAGEAWIFLLLLGLSPDFLSAMLVQIWLMIVNRLTSFVPANLGTQEAGVMAVFAFLGFTPEQALAFALLRRMRQVGWIGLGLALLVITPTKPAGSPSHASAPVA